MYLEEDFMRKRAKSVYYDYPYDHLINETIFGFVMLISQENYFRFYDYSDVKTIASREDETKETIFFSKERQRTITSNKVAVSSKYPNKTFSLDEKLLKVYERINDIFLKHHDEALYSDYTVALIRFIYKNHVYEINPFTFNLKEYCPKYYDDLFLDYRNEMIKIIKEELNVEHIFFDVRLFENNKQYH